MSRTAAFDKQAAIKAARDVFWRDGYAETALPALEKATGLNRSSIYNTFGSKRGLFDAAVDNYLEEVVRPRLRPLLVDAVSPTALTDYITGLGHAFKALEHAPGCLLVNASGSGLAQDEQICRVITNYLDELRGAIARGVGAARPELGSAEQTRLVDAITGLIISAFTLVRVDTTLAVDTLGTANDLLTGHDRT